MKSLGQIAMGGFEHRLMKLNVLRVEGIAHAVGIGVKGWYLLKKASWKLAPRVNSYLPLALLIAGDSREAERRFFSPLIDTHSKRGLQSTVYTVDRLRVLP